MKRLGYRPYGRVWLRKRRAEYAEEERKEKELLASMDSYQKSRYLREKEREKRFGWERRHNQKYGQKYGVEATEPLISGEFIMLPVVDKFSLPNDISPPAAVMVKSPLDALMILPLMFTLSI